MRKNLKSQKSQPKADRPFDIRVIAFFICGLLFLIVNIVSSQRISPFYFGIMNEDKNSVAQYLISIRQEPQFASEYGKYKTIYGDELKNLVFSKENSKKQELQNLEQVLQKNPYARDVLYRLFLLNSELGNKMKGEEYFRQAKGIDPSIK